MYARSIKLIIESKIDDIALLAPAVKAICNTVVQEEVLLYNMELCLVEAVTNVIKHAYHGKPGNSIEVKMTVDDQNIVFEITDKGEKSNLPPPKQDLGHDKSDIATLPESGMGLFLIHKIMEEVTLNQKDGKNVLLMKKILEK